jgi:hypothetical protein
MPVRHSYQRLIYCGFWIGVSLLLIRGGWTEVTTLSGWDPDDQLRLVQLRDFLNGQSWFDTTQYRLNPPDGAPMHWSRLIELPLALLILMFRPLLGQAGAEMVAGTAVPLLLLGWIMYMLMRVATQLWSKEAGIIAVIIAGLSTPFLMQLQPMRIDHHGWQIAMAVLALSTLLWPSARKAGAVLGMALAVWLHISLEGAPLSAAFFLCLGWRWIADPSESQRLKWTISSFAGCSLLLFLATQSSGMSAPTYCDTISPPHIWAIGWGAAIMLPAVNISGGTRLWRIAACGIAAGGAVGIVIWLAPSCLNGAFGTLDPVVRDYWYANVTEGLPVWRQDLHTAIFMLAGSICGVVGGLVLLRDAPREEQQRLLVIGFFTLYSFILSLLVFRTVSVATAYAIPVTAALIARLFRAYRQSNVPARRIAMVAAMLSLLVPGALVSSALKFVPVQGNRTTAKADQANERCQSSRSVAALRSIEKGNFLAPFDMGPTILAQTRHSVLASSHHRNVAGMRDHIEIFRSLPDSAHRLIQARKIDFLVACPHESELHFYARKNPDGLWAQVGKGNVPDWLQPMPDMGKGIKVWRVR